MPTTSRCRSHGCRRPVVHLRSMTGCCWGLRRRSGERDVLVDFIETTGNDLDQLQCLQTSGRASEVGRQAHKSKGAARLIGAIELAEAAQAVNLAGRDGDLQQLHELQPDRLRAVALHLAQRYHS